MPYRTGLYGTTIILMYQGETTRKKPDYERSFYFDVIRYREVDAMTDHQLQKAVDTVHGSLNLKSKKKFKNRYREMVKNYVFNLIKAFNTNHWVRVSRNEHDYKYIERYHHIYTTPTIVIKTMDALYDYGWIEMKSGFYDAEKGKGKITRIRPSTNFIDLITGTIGKQSCTRVQFHTLPLKDEIVMRQRLKNGKYLYEDYVDTLNTRQMRSRVRQYNEMMRNKITLLTLSKNDLLSLKSVDQYGEESKAYKSFNRQLSNGRIVFLEREIEKRNRRQGITEPDHDRSITEDNYIVNPEIGTFNVFNVLKLSSDEIEQQLKAEGWLPSGEYSSPLNGSEYESIFDSEKENRDYFNSLNLGNNNSITSNQPSPSTTTTTTTTTIPSPSPSPPSTPSLFSNIITNGLSEKSTSLQSLDNDSLPVWYDGEDSYCCTIDEILAKYPRNRIFRFLIPHTNMYRIFSTSHKQFRHHGRFYGDPVQNLPEKFRLKITMQGESVVECDYTSLHPYMLYTMVNEAPPENIYIIDKTENEQLRREYKTILLTAINSEDRNTMLKAVQRLFVKKKGFQYGSGDKRLKWSYIEDILDKLIEHNKPIAKFLNTKKGVELMRKDSEIADRIIKEFVRMDRPIRCVHDSFIVQERHESFLKRLMIEKYQEVMDTDYVIGITTEKHKKSQSAPNIVKSRESKNVNSVSSGKVKPVVVMAEVSDDFHNRSEEIENMKYFQSFFEDEETHDSSTIEFPLLPRETFLGRFEGITF